MKKLPEFHAVKDQIKRSFRPRTRWGRVALWSGGLSVFFSALRLIAGSEAGSALAEWADLFAFVFAICALKLSFGWVRRRVMWRLRYRLIVTYVFIGVIPIVLLVMMAGLSGYLFAGQFATYVAISNLRSELHHLEAENDALAADLGSVGSATRANKEISGEVAAVSGGRFPGRTVTVWQGDDGYLLSNGGALIKANPSRVPAAIQGDFSGFVLEGESVHLRTVKRWKDEGREFTVISSVPITPEVLHSVTSQVGSATLTLPGVANAGARVRRRVETQSIPPSTSRLDPTFPSYTIFDAVDWESGESHSCVIGVVTRPSMLYNTLFATMGDKANFLQLGLLAIAILLGLVELVALFIGIRLSRSMTRSVGELYRATEHVNRGDLTHRIQIRGHDQMAALEGSFNSMTDSLVKLLADQKQMQRLENELAIAYEVQNLLFPHRIPQLASLDVYGVCHPARSVSGDYYDFISHGSDGMMLAVGDISGKGISAALLMATAHAFVRAYSLEQDTASLLEPLQAGRPSHADHHMYFRGDGAADTRISTAMLMTTLNYQLFRCTPPEKYATMFLGRYDAAQRALTYCNAGHPPPILFRANGSLSRLDVSGTVVGLFDEAVYTESTVMLQPGDLFVAFSDGVTEPENASGEFGEERLIALIQEHRRYPLSHIGDVVASSVAEWIGEAEQPDDITVVLARAR